VTRQELPVRHRAFLAHRSHALGSG
jgi:hypothetical protein